jgi:hypothetical protein
MSTGSNYLDWSAVPKWDPELEHGLFEGGHRQRIDAPIVVAPSGGGREQVDVQGYRGVDSKALAAVPAWTSGCGQVAAGFDLRGKRSGHVYAVGGSHQYSVVGRER